MGKKTPGEKKSKTAEDAEFNELLKQLKTKSERHTPQRFELTKAEAKKNRQGKIVNNALEMKWKEEAEKVEGLRHAKQRGYIQQLETDAGNAEAWFNLGSTLHPWANQGRVTLGHAIGVSEPVQVGNQTFTEVQCYIMALTLAPKHPKISETWTNLGNAVGVGETVQVGSQSYTKEQCYAHAVKVDPKNNKAWYNLGVNLGDTETIQIGDQIYTKQQCCAQALTLDPKDADPNSTKCWYNLGVSLGVRETVQIGSKSYTKQQCCVNSMRFNPKCTMTLYHLGLTLDVGETIPIRHIPGPEIAHYTKKHLYWKAFEFCYDFKAFELLPNCNDALPWNLLGSFLEVDANEAEGYPPYLVLGPCGWIKIAGKIFTKQQCCIQALTLDPKYVEAWMNLGITLGVGETVQVGSQSYTKEQCYLQALTLDPKHAETWCNLGVSLGIGETAQVGGQPYSKMQCYVQALTIHPKYAEAWYNLGNCLGLGDWAQVGGQIYTQRQCFFQAQTLDPKLISPPSLSTLD